MFSKTFFTLAAMTVAALASPTTPCPRTNEPTGPLTSDLQEQHCGEGAKISCCNSQAQGDGGFLSQLISGLNCIDVPVLAVPVANQCSGSNVAACCSNHGETNGLINIQCVPITL